MKRTLNGFQPNAFQSDAFQQPDAVASGTGDHSFFWRAMLLRALRTAQAKRKREEEKAVAATAPSRVALRFVATQAPKTTPDVQKVVAALAEQMRADATSKADLDAFVKFMEAIVAYEEID